jgi:ribosomal protein L29
MNLKEMRAKVNEELDHIPRHPKPQQSELRMAYQVDRMHSLGKKAKEKRDAADVLHDCIELLSKDQPGVEFQYDKAFFGRRKSSKKGK